MVPNYQEKTVVSVPPQSVADNTSVTCAAVDTYGFEYAEFTFVWGVTALALSTLKIQESDFANMSSPDDITGTVFGTDDNDTGSASTLPSATDDNKAFSVMVDLRGRKRYIQPVISTPVSANNTGLMTVICKLGRPHEAPRLAANSGLAQRLIA